MSGFELAEVFGIPIEDKTAESHKTRQRHECPFVAGKICTKVSKPNPLGVCSIVGGEEQDGAIAIVCPTRLYEGGLALEDAAKFFFPGESRVRALSEIPLHDAEQGRAGRIDWVLVALDDGGEVADFGSLEAQSVYISGNLRTTFEAYMANPSRYSGPEAMFRPDYLSSTRKRLAPQLSYKGEILAHWEKKFAVAVHDAFFDQLPKFKSVDPKVANFVWLIYTLQRGSPTGRYRLARCHPVYTSFESVQEVFLMPSIGEEREFRHALTEELRKPRRSIPLLL